MAINNPLQQKKPNTTGTGFTNIQNILQANKANRLGASVAGGVQQAGVAAKGAINQAGQQFKTEADKERQRLQDETNRASRVLGDVSQASEEDVNAFEGIRGGQSKGPTGIANAAELQGKANEASALGAATGTEAGRYGLLQRYVGGNKQYTGGQQKVDNMLLGQTGAGQLRQAKKSTLGLPAQLATQQVGAQEEGKSLQNTAQGLAKDTLGKLDQQVVDYDTGMEQRAKDAAAQRAAYVSQAKLDLQNGLADEKTLQALGLSAGSNIYDQDLSGLLNESDEIATRQNVQGEADWKKIDALRRLSGQSLTGEASSDLAQYNDKNVVGQFDKAGTYGSIDPQIAKQLISSRANLLQSEVAPEEQRRAFLASTEGGIRQQLRDSGQVLPNGTINQGNDTGITPDATFDQILKDQTLMRYLNGGGGGTITDLYNNLAEQGMKTRSVNSIKDKYKFNRTLQLKPNA